MKKLFARPLNNLKKLTPPIVISVVSFQLVIGLERINPSNIAWLTRTGWLDGWGAYLGWGHYRFTDLSSPIGALPNYGIGRSNSIVYTDSVPLLAIPFRLLTPVLPDNFQYFGIWLLFCFILQGIAAWKLVSLIGVRNFYLHAFVTTILVFSPIMLNRVNMHMSQAAHFLFLLGIYLTIKRDFFNNFKHWFVLLLLSLLIHPYHFVIIALLAATNALWEIPKSNLNLWKFIKRYSWSPIFLILTMWQVGYFQNLSASVNPWRNDLFKMDLLQPLNATGRSWVISSRFPEPLGNQEGFAYFGPGPLIVLLVLLFLGRCVFVEIVKLCKVYFPILILFILFTIYSITYEITIARHTLLSIPLPENLLNLLSSFRASGRFIVLPYYGTVLILFYLLIRFTKVEVAKLVIALAMAIHVADTSFFWEKLRDINTPSTQFSIETWDPEIWSPILTKSNRVFVNYSANKVNGTTVIECPNWAEIGNFSAKYKLETNCFYSARMDHSRIIRSIHLTQRDLFAGKPREGSVYIFDAEYPYALRSKVEAPGWTWTYLETKWVFHRDSN
jgi:hypothetical protein